MSRQMENCAYVGTAHVGCTVLMISVDCRGGDWWVPPSTSSSRLLLPDAHHRFIWVPVADCPAMVTGEAKLNVSPLPSSCCGSVPGKKRLLLPPVELVGAREVIRTVRGVGEATVRSV